MDTRRRAVFGVFLVLVGAALWTFVARPLLGPTSAQWQAQVAQDAQSLFDFVRPDPWIEDDAKVAAAWEKRKALYDEEHLAALRDHLQAFVDFEVAEYADAKDIYLSGRRPDAPSEPARLARERVRALFGEEAADAMIREFREEVREKAYQASPRVGGGADPDLARYDDLYDKLTSDWLPRVRARIDRLTHR